MTRLVLEMKGRGVDVVNLAAGEPDFSTPHHVCDAARAAIVEGNTRYTQVDGTPQLKEAVIRKFQRDNCLSFTPDQISIGAGGKQVISNAFAATLSPGDEVVIPSPYWVSYPDMVAMFDAMPVIVSTDPARGYKLLPEDLGRVITDRTKWFVLNAPCNPTGAVYARAEMEGLAAVLRRYPHVRVLCDDVYESVVFDSASFCSLAQAAPDLMPRLLVVGSVSKTYNMTGWRIGYGAGPSDLIRAMAVVQGQTSGNPCSISQAAACAALEGARDFLTGQKEIYQRRRDFIVEALNNRVKGFSCQKPEGAFYAFANCRALIGAETPEGVTLEDDADVARYFLESEGVAAVCGAAFGCSPYLRFSFAVSDEVLKEAVERLARASARLRLRGVSD